MVLVSPLVKICDFFFFTASMLDASEPCWINEKKKRKEKETPSDAGIQRVVPVPVFDTCQTPTRRQK